MTYNPEYSHTFFLTAGESNAEGLLPVTLLTERIIEVATEHANALGIGYDQLITQNIGWVLSRLTFEMKRYPRINDEYTLTTWIESYNKRFSERNFMITDGKGEVIGYARTVWAAIDMTRRCFADLTDFERERFPIGPRPCPIRKSARLPIITEAVCTETYTFRYCDTDFNRHVNTVRYIELILNHWPLEHYDKYAVERLDISFHSECLYGQTVELRFGCTDNGSICEITADGRKAVGTAIEWRLHNR